MTRSAVDAVRIVTIPTVLADELRQHLTRAAWTGLAGLHGGSGVPPLAVATGGPTSAGPTPSPLPASRRASTSTTCGTRATTSSPSRWPRAVSSCTGWTTRRCAPGSSTSTRPSPGRGSSRTVSTPSSRLTAKRPNPRTTATPHCTFVARGPIRWPRTTKPQARTYVLTCGFAVERATGIEPAYPAWEAGALPLSYARRAAETGVSAARGVSVAERRAA